MNKIISFFSALLFSNLVLSYEADSHKELVRAAISAHGFEVRMCYKDNQKKLKGAQGKIVFDFEVNDQGKLIKSELNEKKTTLRNVNLTNCLKEKINTWMFPASPKGQVVKVTHPFQFKNK